MKGKSKNQKKDTAYEVPEYNVVFSISTLKHPKSLLAGFIPKGTDPISTFVVPQTGIIHIVEPFDSKTSAILFSFSFIYIEDQIRFVPVENTMGHFPSLIYSTDTKEIMMDILNNAVDRIINWDHKQPSLYNTRTWDMSSETYGVEYIDCKLSYKEKRK